jgi:hypothetical protein
MPTMGNATDNELIKAQKLALQLIQRDKRIVQIEGVREREGEHNERLNLVCHFEPEPDCDSTGFFWVAFLMTRIEFETSPDGGELNWPFDIGFRIGENIFLPNGRTLKASLDYTTIWPPNDQ